LEAEGCIESLRIALDGRRNDSPFVLVHHSDRGIQYCSSDYIELLTKANIAISMTQSGSPYENALAERINGIIKGEFFPKRIYQNHREAKKSITQIIWTYNEQRPHASLDYLTPSQADYVNGEIKKRWKHYSKSKIKGQLAGSI
jgi:transposase InsO family protein